MDFPGGSVPFTASMDWHGGSYAARAPLPCYRTIDAAGREVPGAAIPHPLPRETAVRMYETMVRLQTADVLFYEAQRQVGGRRAGLRRVIDRSTQHLDHPAWGHAQPGLPHQGLSNAAGAAAAHARAVAPLHGFQQRCTPDAPEPAAASPEPLIR